MAEQLSITAVLKADMTGFNTAMKGAGATVAEFSQSGKQAGISLKELGQQIFYWANNVKMAVGAVKRIFQEVLGEPLRYANEIKQFSIQTGVATDALQRMGFAAGQLGASQGALNQSLRFLSRNIGEAMQGSKPMVEAFQRIGLSAQQLQSMSVDQVFLRISDAFKSGIVPQSRQAATAMDLFGRGGMQVIEMLRAGSANIKAFGNEAQKLGIVLSEDTLEGAKALQDNLAALDSAWLGLKTTVLNAVLPALNDFTEWLRESAPDAVAWFKTVLAELPVAFEMLGEYLKPVVDTIKGLWNDLMGTIGDADFSGISVSFTEAMAALPGSIEVAGVYIEAFFEVVLVEATALAQKLVTVLGNAFANIPTLLWEGLKLAFANTGAYIELMRELGIALAKALWAGLTGGEADWSGFTNAMTKFGENVGKNISIAFENVWPKLTEGFEGISANAQREVDAIWERAGVKAESGFKLIDEKVAELHARVTKGGEEAVAEAGDAALDKIAEVSDALMPGLFETALELDTDGAHAALQDILGQIPDEKTIDLKATTPPPGSPGDPSAPIDDAADSAGGLGDAFKDAEAAKDSLVNDITTNMPKGGKAIAGAGKDAEKLAKNLENAGRMAGAFGEEVTEGIEPNIERFAGAFVDAVEDNESRLAGAFGGAVSDRLCGAFDDPETAGRLSGAFTLAAEEGVEGADLSGAFADEPWGQLPGQARMTGAFGMPAEGAPAAGGEAGGRVYVRGAGWLTQAEAARRGGMRGQVGGGGGGGGGGGSQPVNLSGGPGTSKENPIYTQELTRGEKWAADLAANQRKIAEAVMQSVRRQEAVEGMSRADRARYEQELQRVGQEEYARWMNVSTKLAGGQLEQMQFLERWAGEAARGQTPLVGAINDLYEEFDLAFGANGFFEAAIDDAISDSMQDSISALSENSKATDRNTSAIDRNTRQLARTAEEMRTTLADGLRLPDAELGTIVEAAKSGAASAMSDAGVATTRSLQQQLFRTRAEYLASLQT